LLSNGLVAGRRVRRGGVCRDGQGDRVGLGLVQVEIVRRPGQLVGVVDQLRDEPVDIGRVVPVARGSAAFEVVLPHPHLA
jgi:hypothetical protein